jgi:hypothetical protein
MDFGEMKKEKFVRLIGRPNLIVAFQVIPRATKNLELDRGETDPEFGKEGSKEIRKSQCRDENISQLREAGAQRSGVSSSQNRKRVQNGGNSNENPGN